MEFIPTGRYLLVAPVPAEEKKSDSPEILRPPEFKPKSTSPWAVVRLLKCGGSSFVKQTCADERYLVVETGGIESIVIKGEVFYLVLDNFVKGEVVM